MLLVFISRFLILKINFLCLGILTQVNTGLLQQLFSFFLTTLEKESKSRGQRILEASSSHLYT